MDNEKERREKEKKVQEGLRNYPINLEKPSLRIARIPEQYNAWFKEYAKKEFCTDYGMALRELIKVFQGFYPQGNEVTDAKIDLIAEQVEKIDKRVSNIEQKSKEPTYVNDGNRKVKKR